MDFWINADYYDLLFSFFLVQILGIIGLKSIIPEMPKYLIKGFIQSDIEIFSIALRRYISPFFIGLYIDFLSVFSFASLLYICLWGQFLFFQSRAINFLFGYLILLAFFLLYRSIYRLMGFVYWEREQRTYFFLYYIEAEVVWFALNFLGLLLFLLFKSGEYLLLAYTIGAFILWRILIIISAIRTSKYSYGLGYIYLFLYLCAHEIVPFLVLYILFHSNISR